MPLTPVTWRDQQTVNTVTAGLQLDPDILQLANGNILVSWASDADTGGPLMAGLDVIGQLFDPLGNRIGGEFQLNTSFSLDDEQDMAIAALPGGGFIQVDQDTDATATSLRLQERTATGATATASATIVSDASAADPAFRNPKIAVSSDTSALIVYEAVFGGNADIVYKLYDPATNTYSAQFGLFNELESVTNADVTVLSNGNYVVTANVGAPTEHPLHDLQSHAVPNSRADLRRGHEYEHLH